LNPATTVRPLNAVGGWGQVKIRPHARWEINGAVGDDNVLARDIEWAPRLIDEYPAVYARNRAAFVNVIFRPRSSLVLSMEHRRLWTWDYLGKRGAADQVNLAAGVSF